MNTEPAYLLHPIGYIRKSAAETRIELLSSYTDGLLGIEGFSHIIVCYWLHENDNEEGRSMLRVHPRHDVSNPLTGVFATHSPKRPNPIAISICGLERVTDSTLYIDQIDAFDGSPVVDIKCFIPLDDRHARVPDWV
jgi:tRNA-Thr(GGU) m(6)t(6)A37 methyltransferase TsaA